MDCGEPKTRLRADLSRRSFLKAAALTESLLATEACHPQSGTKLIPYLVPETGVVPGVPAFYKSICRECDAGCGVVARVREGPIIKLEGNPENPINAGALCACGQAALQGLYNPDRLAHPRLRSGNSSHEQISWERVIEMVASRCGRASGQSDRVAFLGEHRGLSFDRVLTSFLAGFNSNERYYYNPVFETAAREATMACFGRTELPQLRIDQAKVLVWQVSRT